MSRVATRLLPLAVLALAAVHEDARAQSAPALDEATLVQVVPLLLPPEDAAARLAEPPETQARLAARDFDRIPEAHRSLLVRRVLYAKEKLAENGNLLSARTVALVTLGPPRAAYHEPAHAWAGETVRKLETAELVGELDRATRAAAGEKADAPPTRPEVRLEGKLPTWIWVYPVTATTERVLWFVDEDGDGTYRLVKDETRPAGGAPSTVTPEILPGDLYEQLGFGREFEPLPALKTDALNLEVPTYFFQAADGKTFTRFVVTVDPSDVELELSLPPAEYQAAASAWLRIEQGGQPIYQREIPAGTGGLASLGGHWGADFGLPLLPGDYDWTAVVVDEEGRGGRKVGSVTVPSLAGDVMLSSVVLGAAVQGEGGLGLPKAKDLGEGELAPFQVGSYEVRPRTPAVFKRGETLAVAVQVYGASKATVDFDVYMNDVLQGTVETLELTSLPSPELQLIPILEAWPDAKYKIKVVATGPGGAKVEREVSFRVKG